MTQTCVGMREPAAAPARRSTSVPLVCPFPTAPRIGLCPVVLARPVAGAAGERLRWVANVRAQGTANVTAVLGRSGTNAGPRHLRLRVPRHAAQPPQPSAAPAQGLRSGVPTGPAAPRAHRRGAPRRVRTQIRARTHSTMLYRGQTSRRGDGRLLDGQGGGMRTALLVTSYYC